MDWQPASQQTCQKDPILGTRKRFSLFCPSCGRIVEGCVSSAKKVEHATTAGGANSGAVDADSGKIRLSTPTGNESPKSTSLAKRLRLKTISIYNLLSHLCNFLFFGIIRCVWDRCASKLLVFRGLREFRLEM